MYQEHVIVTTKHGRMPSFVACPDGPGPFPAVIFYMDAPGTREELRNMARRIARHGYFVILPDMYYRLGTILFDLNRRDDSMSGVVRAAMNSLSNEKVTDDTAAMLQWLDGNDKVKPGPVGCVGYCMSGQYSVNAAARHPERVFAAASIYGVRLVTDKPDSPHLAPTKTGAELYFGCAETDHWAPPEMVEALRTAMAGKNAEVELYPGVDHGFAFPQRPVYNKQAAERHWERLFSLFHRRLQA